jgi:long-chain acyl-CoA synthetase
MGASGAEVNIATLLHNAARSFGDRPALSVGDELLLSYATLSERAARLAAGLRAREGLAPGARVALVMSNRPAYLEVLFGIWHAGLVAVPLNARLHAREVAYILDHCQASLCFVSDDVAAAVGTAAQDVGCVKRVICVDDAEYGKLLGQPMAPVDRERDDLAWIFYTSGTTGRPKGAMLTHLNLRLMAWSYLCDFDLLTENDTFLVLGPQSHAAGLLGLSHVAKASHHVLPASGGFDPSEVATLIDRLSSVTFFGAPTMLRRLVESPAITRCRVDNIRTIIGGGASFYLDDVKRVLATFGPRFLNGYGQGECPNTITAMRKHLYAGQTDERLVSVGLARTGVEVRTVDAQDAEVRIGEIGEIVVRSDIVMRGYLEDDVATARTVVQGWLHTGDLGVMDERGFLWLKDRNKDLIISGGSNIYPREVEDVLLGHPWVAEVAVVGQPDPEWGESVVAFVVVRDGCSPSIQELDRLCLDNLARFKRPKRYEFVQALPRNSTGKVLKTQLRAGLLEKAGPG